MPEKVTEDSLGEPPPATHMRDALEAPGSVLCCGTALVVLAVNGAQQIGDIFLPISLCNSYK